MNPTMLPTLRNYILTRILWLGLGTILILSGCGGSSGNGAGTFTLTASGQFPVQSNSSLATTGEVNQCSFFCEATVGTGGVLLLNSSFDTTVDCFNGEPLGGEVTFFDHALVETPGFEQPFQLDFSCTNLAEDLLLGVVGGFHGQASFRANAGQDVNPQPLALFRQDLVNIDFCYGQRVETTVLAELLLLCTRTEEDVFTGLGGLCGVPPEDQVAWLNEYFGCPYCGDGVIGDQEECESDADCGENGFCRGCQCEVTACGDGFITGDEQCDFDSHFNSFGCEEPLVCGEKSCRCQIAGKN